MTSNGMPRYDDSQAQVCATTPEGEAVHTIGLGEIAGYERDQDTTLTVIRCPHHDEPAPSPLKASLNEALARFSAAMKQEAADQGRRMLGQM
jgi:uncharacterized protein (DUF885 family)